MLIHITPRIYLAYRYDMPACELVDLTISELGMTLLGGEDLASRRPYPNKNYVVACRKVGQKAIDGILIDTHRPVRTFCAVARWAINANLVLTHRTNYVVLDDDFDAVSDKMVLWDSMPENMGGWGSRWPEFARGWAPAHAQPRMDMSPITDDHAHRVGDVQDSIGAHGLIAERIETFRMPTIERGRLHGERAIWDRLPPLETAFKAIVSQT
jgi:hypothetical protein